MNKLIQNLSIGQYRGIKSLVINNLNSVNVIVGDNNSGKTTLLETIYLLRAPHSFNNVLRSSKLRNTGMLFSIAPYESFLNIFPKDILEKHIYIQADGNFGNISLEIGGEETTTIVNENDLSNFPSSMRHIQEKKLLGSEIPGFLGVMKSTFNSSRKETPIRLIGVSRSTFYGGIRKDQLNVEYLSPISHITENTFSNILKNDYYKSICVQLIRLFDPDIEDLVYMRNDITGRAVEYIKSSKLGLMPLSTYGDSIKKVLSLANGIISAKGGVLLIDEIDTSIHYKYYADIFSFLIKTAAKFDVQLFITTHSEEAILEILKTQNYNLDTPPEHDIINIVTFRKNKEGDVHSRSMNGFEVYSNRELFDFEVRI